MIDACRRVSAAPWFQKAVLALIVLNALVMGLETWPSLEARWGSLFQALNGAIQLLFVVELAIRILAFGRQPLAFFKNGWNIFDFTVVLLSLLPAAGALANIARLARVLRVGRLISGIPELRLIIETMFRSIPSMAHIVLLVGLLIYVYGVIGNHLFSRVDAEHWGTLGRAAHTLFVVITLEGWVDLLAASSQATEWAWVYYVSFIVIAVFVVINLFIAVVLNNLEKVRDEMADADAADSGPASRPSGSLELGRELVRLHARLDELQAALRGLGVARAAGPGAASETEAGVPPVVPPSREG